MYINANTPLKTKCRDCKHEWSITVGHVWEGCGCPNCYGNVKYTLEQVTKLFKDRNLQFLDAIYINANAFHLVKCLDCKIEWKTTLHSVLQGAICRDCAGIIRYSLENIKPFYEKENLTCLATEYIGCHATYKTQCNECHHIWWPTFWSIKNNGSGCPLCNTGKSEKLSIKYLKELTSVVPDKKRIQMQDCDFQSYCIVDAFFEINNTQIIIEINGEQHYKPVNFSGNWKIAKKNFERQVKRDEWLREYCKANKIILIEVDLRKYQGEQIKEYLKEQFMNYVLIKDIDV